MKSSYIIGSSDDELGETIIPDMDEFVGFNIKEIFREEMEKAKKPHSREYYVEITKNSYIQEKIIAEFFNNLEELFCVDVCKALLNTLDRISIEPRLAHQIFIDILKSLNKDKEKLQSEGITIGKIAYEIKTVESAALIYCENQILKEIKNFDLPEKLKCIRRTLSKEKSNTPQFRHKALLSLEKGIEEEIRLQREEVLHRKQLNLPENVELITDEDVKESANSKYFVPRDQKEVFLTLEIMLRLLHSTGNHTDKGKLMSFLSGYSAATMRQFFSKSESWNDKREHLESIRRLCSEFGLLSVRKVIEKEIAVLGEKR